MTHNLGLYVHHTLNVKLCCGEMGNVGNWETHPYDFRLLYLLAFLLLTDNNDNTGFDRIYYLKLAVKLFKQKERERERL